ncbi:hypothetical protein CsatB_000729 [Cannabis sativa]|uniref:uncharacterized mitochondrial protein AtMg00240-like n=1 Tax=Cannabis sativa TaxID=3483 RepID=UPI0029C9DA48|nr:uncharacterized mitochondrial protein AtMg00240-like [Cannabis sativa]
METNLKLSKDKANLLPDPTAYRSLIGKLIYLTITRPDITYAVNHLSQFLTCPRAPHLHAAHRILQFLKSTPGQGLFFPSDTTATISAYAETSLSPQNVQVSFFSDADWGACQDTRRSISGYLPYSLETPLSHGSQKNNKLFHNLLLKQNIEPWPMLHPNSHESSPYSRILASILLPQHFSIATTPLQST